MMRPCEVCLVQGHIEMTVGPIDLQLHVFFMTLRQMVIKVNIASWTRVAGSKQDLF